MGKPLLLQLSSVLVQQRDLLKLGMVIDSYNDHCSAPFSRACWLAYAPPTLLGSGSRHCHGINFTNYPVPFAKGIWGSHPTLTFAWRFVNMLRPFKGGSYATLLASGCVFTGRLGSAVEKTSRPDRSRAACDRKIGRQD